MEAFEENYLFSLKEKKLFYFQEVRFLDKKRA